MAHFGPCRFRGPDLLSAQLLQQPVVIFIDDIDYLQDVSFSYSDLFDWIENCYRLRGRYRIYRNLNFVVLGMFIPADLIQNEALLEGYPPSLTPGSADGSLNTPNIHSTHSVPSTALLREITLENFQLVDTYCLQKGFQEKVDNPMAVLKAILKWTNGQPFLTQKICQLVSMLMDDIIQTRQQRLAPSIETLNQWIDHVVWVYIQQFQIPI